MRQQVGWSPGQRILNDAGARMPEHTLDPPVPVLARIVWEDDDEEFIDTGAAGWSGQLVSVRVPDTRYRRTSGGWPRRAFGDAKHRSGQQPSRSPSCEMSPADPDDSAGLRCFDLVVAVEELVDGAIRSSVEVFGGVESDC
jgi:hypothetical protein